MQNRSFEYSAEIIPRNFYPDSRIPWNADLVIIDDNAAKKTAKYLGLSVTGTLGILLKAKKLGILKKLHPLLLEMKQNGFYIDSALEAIVLEQAGEQ